MPPLTLTILGCGPAAPNPGGVCSGYLLRQGENAVLIDCGSGVAGRLAEHVPAQRLNGVAISHLHPDHYFDLVPLYYALKFGEPRPPTFDPHLKVYVPPGGRAFLSRLGELIGDRPAMLEDVLDIHEYAPDRETVIGGLKFAFHPVQHYVLSHSMRVTTADGLTLVFSSDVAPCRELVDAARGADLFLCESALLDVAQDEADPALRGHLTAAEAGQIAREAGARRLVITHYRSGEVHDAHHQASASRGFGGPVELAREGKTFVVG
jgi:ribonuclease BN (tRNA processing enzyme)